MIESKIEDAMQHQNPGTAAKKQFWVPSLELYIVVICVYRASVYTSESQYMGYFDIRK